MTPDPVPPARRAEWFIAKLALGLGMAIVAVLFLATLFGGRGDQDAANDAAIRGVVGRTVEAARADGRDAVLRFGDGSELRIRGGAYGIGVRVQGQGGAGDE